MLPLLTRGRLPVTRRQTCGSCWGGGAVCWTGWCFPEASRLAKQHWCQRARDLGFLVGLHTGGAYPKRLEQLLNAGLLDWVGLDVKGLAQNYPQVVGRPQAHRAGTDAWRALDLVLAAHRAGTLSDYEVRITAYPGTDPRDTNPAALPALAQALHERGVECLAVQQARPDGTRPEFQELCAQNHAKSFAVDLARQAEELTGMFTHFTFRGTAG